MTCNRNALTNTRQAYATDLHKDGAQVFAFKVSGSKHSFEAQNALERDGWYLAVEKAITEAKASKDTIESSEAYKEEKEKISKFTHFSTRDASGKCSLALQSTDFIQASPPH
jgi:hypothetical protein